MFGWQGRVWKVHLNRGTLEETRPDPDILRRNLGGRGLGEHLFLPFASEEACSPESPLVFAVGPLCGTPAPTSARIQVVGRSPLTGTVMDCSAGGRFAHRFKAVGIDGLVITGRAAEPCVLALSPSGVEILPAHDLWGQDTLLTTERLGSRGSVACIGPAGERLVRFASLVFDAKNVAGRGGLGAVLGAKNVKAITVQGDVATDVADTSALSRAREDILRLFRASPAVMGEFGLASFGTPALVDIIGERRMAPTANFRQTVFAGSSAYSGAAIRKHFGSRKDGCFGCPIQCKKATSAGMPLPEYETVSHFGGLLLNRNLEHIVRANTACNLLGMDTISMAATLACFGEARGNFPGEDEVAKLVEATAMRQGIGDRLAEGSRRFMESLGKPELSMTVKSLELPAYDPRGSYGMALAYGTSNRGGDHLRAYPVGQEILRKPIATDRFSFSGKARIISLNEDQNAVIDSLIACKFAFFGASLEEYAAVLEAVTGIPYTAQGLLGFGADIVRGERRINWNNGFRMADDFLPDRFFTEPGTSGEGVTIPPLDRQRYREELVRYYRIRGLNDDGSFPD